MQPFNNSVNNKYVKIMDFKVCFLHFFCLYLHYLYGLIYKKKEKTFLKMNLIYSNRSRINGIDTFEKKNSSECFKVVNSLIK